jgi:hypothetical protein
MDSLPIVPRRPAVPQIFNTRPLRWFHPAQGISHRDPAKQNSNDCGDNLNSSAIFGAWGTFLVSVCWPDHNGEVGTMRWKFTIDHDDLTLAVAALISALAISLALI